MPEQKINQELRLKKKKNEIRNYLVEEINRHELISKKHAKLWIVLIACFLQLLQLLDVFPFLLLHL